MMTIRKRRPDGNHPPLPLFAWADTCDRHTARPLPLAIRIIGRRHRLSPPRAALVCELAGIGGAE